jgi:hypothetical protein
MRTISLLAMLALAVGCQKTKKSEAEAPMERTEELAKTVEMGTMIIVTSPSGAKASVNGSLLSERTPTIFSGEIGKSYDVVVDLSGYTQWEGTFKIDRPEVKVIAALKRISALPGFIDQSNQGPDSSLLPEAPTRGDITSGIGKVRGLVNRCGDKHMGSGTVKVKMLIGGNGRVESAQASGGEAALRSCVESAVKRAKFKKTQKGTTVTYPFVFR